MKLTKRRLYFSGGVIILLAMVPIVFKSLAVNDELTMKVLDVIATMIGLTLGGSIIGAAMAKSHDGIKK